MAHSPHRRQRGHCGLCKPHKIKGLGRSEREPSHVLRQLGKRKRVGRGDLGDQEQP